MEERNIEVIQVVQEPVLYVKERLDERVKHYKMPKWC